MVFKLIKANKTNGRSILQQFEEVRVSIDRNPVF